MGKPQRNKISHFLGPFLKEQIEAWLAADKDRTKRQLAEMTGLGEQQVGRIVNYGEKAGYGAADALHKVLGFATPEEVIAAARIWWVASGRVPAKQSADHPSRLKDRPEWNSVVRVARAERPEIMEAEAFSDAGEIYDGELFDRPLSPHTVGHLAYVFYVQRCARRRGEES
jgi:hypothetical protein